MSSALAIAGVSAVLRDLLNDGLINNNATGTLGTSVLVSVGPPDRVIPSNGTEATQLNLFMYQVTPNTGWRNEGLPSRDGSGRTRLTNPPLAINLHYLISAHASEDFHGDILLGYAMQLLHETPVLSREAIKKALSPTLVVDPLISTPPPAHHILPSKLQSLMTSGLEEQIELIKITPEYLNSEEMSRLWTATQSHLRPAVAYMASVVLIQAKETVVNSRRVLQRGENDKGVDVHVGAWPQIQSVRVGTQVDMDRIPVPPSWPSARFGLWLDIQGAYLSSQQVKLRFEHPLMTQLDVVIAQADRTEKRIKYALPLSTDPTANTTWAAGIYTVSALVEQEGKDRVSNKLPLALAAQITTISIPPGSSHGTDVMITISCSPEVRVDAKSTGGVWKLTLKQKVSLRLAGRELDPEPLADSSSATKPESIGQLSFNLKSAPAITNETVILRVDGVDSIPFMQADPLHPQILTFDPAQQVSIP